MKNPKRDPAELLSAYADGGLDPDEAAEVEAYLAAHPGARAEFDEIRRTIDGVRAAAEPPRDPDWDAMARDIARACHEAPPAQGPGARIAAWLWPPRPAAVALAAAAAGAVLIAVKLFGSGGERVAAGPDASPPASQRRALAQPASPADDEAIRLEQPFLEDASDEEIDSIAEELTEPALSPFGSPDYLSADELADELDDDDLAAIDEFLAEKG